MSSVPAGQQQYAQRNVFYLRASPYVVLQTVLYLDHRHVDWMNQSPLILPQVLAVLRTRIMPKLRKEADSSGKVANMSKKERVDVYSHPDFQVAYFFRRMDDRHSVLLKEKSLVFPLDPTLSSVKVEDEAGNLHAPIPRGVQASTANTGASTHSTGAIRIKDSPDSDLIPLNETDAEPSTSAITDGVIMPSPSLSESRQRDAQSVSDDDEGDDEEPSASPRRSKRTRTTATVKDEPDHEPAYRDSPDIDYVGEVEENAAIPQTLEDEEKMKPKLQVKYAGFRIFGKLLVLVIEPSKRMIASNPALFGDKTQTEIRQLSVAPVLAGQAGARRSSRQGSVQTRFTSLEPASDRSSSRNASLSRGPTPLFRGATPADSEFGSPAPRSSFGTPGFDRENSVDLTGDQDDDDEPTVGQLEGFDLATQMLEREEQTAGGNDIEEGD